MKKKKVLRSLIIMLVMLCIVLFPVTSFAKNKTISKSTKSITLKVGKQYTLKVKNTKVKWSPKTTKVLTIDKSGKIKALKSGSAKISYKIGNKTKKIKVKVKKKASKTKKPKETASDEDKSSDSGSDSDSGSGGFVWISETGSCYHSINNCGRMNPAKATRISLSSAIAQGYTQCSKCF